MNTQTVSITLIKHSCITCGIVYGIESECDERLSKNHKSFSCPNGHTQHYTAETEEEKLNKQLQRERQQHDQTKANLEYTEKQRQCERGQVTKIKNRIKNGICPCCKRSFANIGKHMKTKHPKY